MRGLGYAREFGMERTTTGAELAHQKLSKPLAFMPGARTVKVNNTTATVQIAAGSVVELKTGAILTQLFILHAVLLAISPAILMVITAAVGAQARGWI